MKVETKKAEFTPVVITLESQEEVNQMFSVLRRVEFDGTEMNNWDNILHSALEPLTTIIYSHYYDEEDDCLRIEVV